MSTHACTDSLSAARVAAPFPPTLGERLRAVAAAWTTWRQRRTAAAQALRSDRDLAALSAHVLRDIGVRDTQCERAVFGSPLDFEIRG